MKKFDARESVLQIKEKKKMLETPQYDKKEEVATKNLFFVTLGIKRYRSEKKGKKVKKSEKSESLRKKSRIFADLICFS